MLIPAAPPHEADRLDDLTGLDILDTAAEERFDRYTRLACRLFDVPIALVSLVDEQRQWFKSRQGLAATETSRDVSFCGHAILGDETFVVPDASTDTRFADNPLVVGDPGIRFYAGFPLEGAHGHRLGTLCIVDRRPRRLAPQDLVALRDIGTMVASELSAVQLATTDHLTGISNRRGFVGLARRALLRCEGSGRRAALVMIDMDGFKAINDEFGHAQGDRALVEFAALLLAAFGEADAVGRLGGDEFCALLTDTTRFQAEAGVERLRSAVRARNCEPHCRVPLAFSAGIADGVVDQQRTALKDLLMAADARMYRRKRGHASRKAA